MCSLYFIGCVCKYYPIKVYWICELTLVEGRVIVISNSVSCLCVAKIFLEKKTYSDEKITVRNTTLNKSMRPQNELC